MKWSDDAPVMQGWKQREPALSYEQLSKFTATPLGAAMDNLRQAEVREEIHRVQRKLREALGKDPGAPRVFIRSRQLGK